MKKKLLIFSDCFTYSGSENVIENILLSEEVTKLFDIQFLYTYNPDYDRRFKERAAQFGIDLNKTGTINVLSPDHAIYQSMLNRKQGMQKVALSLKKWILLLLRVSFLSYFINIARLRKAFKKIKPDVIFINNGGYPASLLCRLAVFAAKQAGISKVVFNINNMAAPVRRPYENYIDKYIKEHVDVFVTASYAAQRRVIEVRHFPAGKFVRIPNTIFNDEQLMGQGITTAKEDHTPILFGAVGLLTERKGFHILLDAIALLVNQHGFSDFKVQIIGDGEERERLQEQASRLNITTFVDFKGFQQKPLEFVKAFDVFVLSSTKNEDFPYVVVEAMLLHKPIIGTRVAGVPEQVDNGTSGYVVDPSDAGQLAEVMLRFRDKRFTATAGQHSFDKYTNEFSYKKVLPLYAGVFARLAGIEQA